jgi:hypothetical protein
MELLTLLLKIEENTHCVTKHRGNSSFLLLNIEGVTHGMLTLQQQFKKCFADNGVDAKKYFTSVSQHKGALLGTSRAEAEGYWDPLFPHLVPPAIMVYGS